MVHSSIKHRKLCVTFSRIKMVVYYSQSCFFPVLAPSIFANASTNFTVVNSSSIHSNVVTSSSIHSVPLSNIAPSASSTFVRVSSTVVTPPRPCASAMCHQNATCAVSGDVAICTCNSGFTGDGRNCNGENL